eukprot:m.173905 g.173905  ORF g.173905 m.173905 type:complete len:145 (+) comp39098_c0_seq12:1118-1552(+)
MTPVSQCMETAGLSEDTLNNLQRLSFNSVCLVCSIALGQGFRLGFLGLLHMDVFRQRLEQEFDASVIVTAPTVPFKAILKKNSVEVDILSPSSFPEVQHVAQYQEPIVTGTLIFPDEYMGKMISLCTVVNAKLFLRCIYCLHAS